MAIAKSGIFTIPLYHGTTELFLKSIKELGLGGKDPLVELGAKEFMHELYDIAEKQNWSDDYWSNLQGALAPTINQDITEWGFNFKHGESYLTYSPQLAIKYAVENPFGCEYLTNMRRLLKVLVKREVSEVYPLIEHPIVKLGNEPHDPYIISINDIELEDVETETGQPMEEQLKKIEELMEIGIMGPLSFKLKNPICYERLTINKLGTSNKNGTFVREEGIFSELITSELIDLPLIIV